jgi:hypothetical protein
MHIKAILLPFQKYEIPKSEYVMDKRYEKRRSGPFSGKKGAEYETHIMGLGRSESLIAL